MIVGHGVDLQEIGAIQEVYAKQPRFASKVLTAREQAVFEQLKGKRQLEYLAGRWAAKEAFAKALGTGIGRSGVTFQELEILNNSKGAPYVTKSPFLGRVLISISHSASYVLASVILEEAI